MDKPTMMFFDYDLSEPNHFKNSKLVDFVWVGVPNDASFMLPVMENNKGRFIVCPFNFQNMEISDEIAKELNIKYLVVHSAKSKRLAFRGFSKPTIAIW